MLHILQSAVAFAAVLGTLIIIHEFGHYLVARWFGIRIEVFSVGFGKRLFGFRKGDTDYRVSLIPLGGYVQMAGDTHGLGATGAADEFLSKPRWQRFLVALAGPAMNILLALALPAILAMAHNEAPAYLTEPAVIRAVDPGSPAERAGLRRGDVVIAADGQGTPTWRSVEDFVAMRPGQTITLLIDRAGERQSATLAVARAAFDEQPIGYAGLNPELGPDAKLIFDEVSPGSPAGRAGLVAGDQLLAINDEEIEQNDYGRHQSIRMIRTHLATPLTFKVRRGDIDLYVDVTPRLQDGVPRVGIHQTLTGVRMADARLSTPAAFKHSVDANRRVLALTVTALGQAVAGSRSLRDTFSGPVQLFQYSGDAAKRGLPALLNLMAVLSLSLALFNLLPVPALDGGVMFMLILEKLLSAVGLPLSMQVRERMLQIGAIVLIVLTSYAFINDLSRLIAPPAPQVSAPNDTGGN